MNLYLFLRFLHILGALLLIGGVLARQLVRSRIRQVADRVAFIELVRAASLIDQRLVIPGSILVLLVGLLLAWMTGAPVLGFLQGASQNWLLVSNVLILAGMFIVVRLFIPLRKRLETWIEHSEVNDNVPVELLEALQRRRLRLAYLLESLSLLVIVALMVFKPF